MSSTPKSNRRIRSDFAVRGETIEDGDDIYAAQVTTPLGDAQTLIRDGMVSVSETDANNKHLQNALVANSGEITLTQINRNGDEQLRIGIDSVYAATNRGPSGSYERSLYRMGAVAPSAPSSPTSITNRGDNPSVPASWAILPPATNDPIWVTIQRVNRDSTTVTYTDPRRWNGLRGAAGSFERTLYRAANTAPNAPSSSTLSSADAAPSAPSNWSIEPPSSALPIWATVQRVARDSTAVTYTTPVRWDGLDGSFERVVYRSATSAPSIPSAPTSIANTDATPSVPSGWQASPPGGNVAIWASVQRVARGSTTVTYTTPRRWDGLDGLSGSFERVVYRSAASAPSTPTAPSSISDAHAAPSVPSNWQANPPSGALPVWASAQRVARGSTTVTYTEPVRWDGPAGSFERTVYRAAASAPSTPANSTLADEDDTPSVPNGWQASLPSGDTPIWATVQRVARGSTTVTYTAPVRWDGPAGSFERTLYRAANTAPNAPSSSTLAGELSMPSLPSDWLDAPASSGMPIWATIQRVARGSTTVTYTAPVRWDGPAGSFERTVYRSAASAPSTPSAPGSVDDADATPSVPSGWQASPPSGDMPIWASVQRIDRNSRNVTYTAPRRWDGLDGPSGNFERTLYRTSRNAPSTPTAPALVEVDEAPIAPSQWSAQPPSSNNPIWATIQRVARGATAVTYTAPVRWDGPAGSFERTLYRAANTAPDAPANSTLNTELRNPSVPNNWQASPPSGDTIWVTIQRVQRNSRNVTYTAPRRWNGLRGAAGSFERTLYRSRENAPNAPSSPATIVSADDSPSVPSNWSIEPPGGDLTIWATVQRVDRDSTAVTYTTPRRWNGPAGPSGGIAGSYERHLYQAAAAAPDTPANGSVPNQEDVPSLPSGWSLTPPDNEDNPTWATIQRIARGSTTVTYTAPRRWDGAPGEAGSFERALYRAATTAPDIPTSPMQVNAAGDDPSAPSGWQASPPSGNDPIWVTIQRVERGDTGVMYTTPVRWNGLDGADGVDGTNGLSGSFERALYRANNTAPSAPSSGMLASADNTPSVPANWSTQPPDSVHPVWVVIQRVERGAVAVNYTTPVRWDGERGDDGLAGSFERLLFRAAASAPSAPTNSSLASADDTPALPSNWAAQPPDTNQPVYATFQRVARGATAVTYTTPVRWDGPMGARGMPGGFGLQLIGRTTGSSFQITDRWKNTGIAMPTTREDGELWAIGVNNSIFMFEPDKLFSVNNANQSNAIGIINNSITLQVFNQNRYVRILPMREVFDSPVSPFLPQAVIQLGISGGDAIGSNGFAVGGDILITSYLHSPLNSFTPISIYRVRGFQSGRESHLGTSDVASDVTDTGIVDGRGPFTVPADGDATERIINFTQHPAKTPAGMEVYTSGVNKGKILLPAGRWLLCVGLQMRSSIMNSEVSGVLGIYYDGNLRHPQTIKMNRPENAHRYEGAVSVSGGVVSDGVKLTWIGLSLDTADATNQITLQAGHVHIFEQ